MLLAIGVASDFPELLIPKLRDFSPCSVTDEDLESNWSKYWTKTEATDNFFSIVKSSQYVTLFLLTLNQLSVCKWNFPQISQ